MLVTRLQIELRNVEVCTVLLVHYYGLTGGKAKPNTIENIGY